MKQIVFQVDRLMSGIYESVLGETIIVIREIAKESRDAIIANAEEGYGYKGRWKDYRSKDHIEEREKRGLPVHYVDHSFEGEMLPDFQPSEVQLTFKGAEIRVLFMTGESRDKAYWNQEIYGRPIVGFSPESLENAEKKFKFHFLKALK